MVGPSLSTSRSISSTPAEHVADHNTLHQVANLLDLNAPPALQADELTNGQFYAARYAGASADAKAQAAVDAAIAAGGGTVILPAGVLDWTTQPVRIPGNNAAGVKIRGSKVGTTVRLSSGCPRFVDFWRTADGQTFTDVTVEDLTVDANNVGGKHHVIIGNCIDFAGGPAHAVNFARIRVRRVRAINVPIGTDDAVDLRVGVAIQSWNDGDAPDAQNTITDVIIEDVDVVGGKVGVQIAGFPYGGGVLTANVWIDNVHVRGGSHICPTPTALGASNHVIIGNKGWGGFATIKDFKGVGCGDCGIEINAIQSFIGSRIDITDAWNHAFYNANYHAPIATNSQVHRWTDCSAHRTAAALQGNGLHYAVKQNGNYAASVIVDGMQWDDFAVVGLGGSALGDGIMISGPQRATVRDFHGYANFGTYAGSVAVTSVMVFCDSLDTSQTARLTLDNVRCKYAGTKSGSGSVTLYGIRVGKAGFTDFRASKPEVDFVATSCLCYGFAVGDSGSTPTVRGTIDQPSIGTSGASSLGGIRIFGTATTTIAGAVTILDPDFSRLQSTTNEVEFAGTSNAAKVQIVRPRWRTLKTPSAITVGASPYSYQNLDGYTERVIVRGGTVSLIELTVDGTNFEDVGVIAGAFLVEPGATLRVTYSVLPTMRKVPPTATAAA